MTTSTPTSFFITRARHPEVDDYMVLYSDGTCERVLRYEWLHLIDWHKAQYDADSATYWVAGVDTSDPMTAGPVDEAEAFGARW